MNRLSKVFQPCLIVPKNAVVKNNDITSKSQKLMMDLGLMKPAANGTFHILPVLQKSLERITSLIDKHMQKAGAQKIVLPTLTASELWKKTGRYDTACTELLTTKDRHGKIHILSPTHEESITALMASISPLSYRQLPLRLYQITQKFRDEMKPRFGLMRTKEFSMKDLYTFDQNLEQAKRTYDEINAVYQNLLTEIGIPYVKVQGDTGDIGGSMSHEYHYPSNVGEDQLVSCSTCNYAANKELQQTSQCQQCNGTSLVQQSGIEIAHTFILEDKYSKVLGATYLQANGKPTPLVMGCYGIGVTRLIAACLECLSTENEIRWPFVLAPYKVCILPPKSGSKEEESTKHWTAQIYQELNRHPFINDSIMVDDRTNLTIGKRFLEAKRMGYPLIIVVGAKAADPTSPHFEYHNLVTNQQIDFSYTDLLGEIVKFVESANTFI